METVLFGLGWFFWQYKDATSDDMIKSYFVLRNSCEHQRVIAKHKLGFNKVSENCYPFLTHINEDAIKEGFMF